MAKWRVKISHKSRLTKNKGLFFVLCYYWSENSTSTATHGSMSLHKPQRTVDNNIIRFDFKMIASCCVHFLASKVCLWQKLKSKQKFQLTLYSLFSDTVCIYVQSGPIHLLIPPPPPRNMPSLQYAARTFCSAIPRMHYAVFANIVSVKVAVCSNIEKRELYSIEFSIDLSESLQWWAGLPWTE